MYPDWPESDADLLPLPRCDGPKLKPFRFDGPQKIKFLDYLGEGSHGHVFKVEIQGKAYALKLFRFIYPGDWLHLDHHDHNPIWAMRKPEESPEYKQMVAAFVDYSEPFNNECRAFGRIQEAGREDLATKCFGYLLLSEENERLVMEQFGKHPGISSNLSFAGSIDDPGWEAMRSNYPGKNSGRSPPIRGIVKELAQCNKRLTTPIAKKLLHSIKELQRLGITSLDVELRQVFNDGIFSDLSLAVTVEPYHITRRIPS
ncbi:kinetochore Sim4 complex subunit Fta2 [Hypoxylon sp. FL1150]|nr:kinetochore Sim4 complex subunit Fta2 [Hypoxylon sp. FL1150]